MNLPALQRLFSQDWHVLPSAIEPLLLAILNDEDKPFDWAAESRGTRPTYDIYGDALPQLQMTTAGVAIVPIHGAIAFGATYTDKYRYGVISPQDIADDLDQAINQGAQTILLDVFSPGGTMLGHSELAAKIDELAGSIDIFSYNGAVSASLAEYLTASSTARFATASSINGSIGTISQSFDLTALLDKFGVKVNTFVSGKYKGMGSPFRALTDTQKEFIQSSVNQAAAEFKDRMTLYRPDLQPADMEGQIFDGRQAQKIGLIDELANSRADVLSAIS